MKKKLAPIALSCLLLFSITVLCSNAQPPTDAKIIFMTDRKGNWEIYIMNKDGSNPRNLTRNPGDDFAPRWSPDGSTIAFCSGRDREGWEADVYLMEPDGRNQRSLGNTAEAELDIGWSPDGTQIVMEVNLGRRQIFVMDADGDNRVQLTDAAQGENQQPSWCPDGSIAFTSDRDGNGEIYLMDADGGNPRRITNHPAIDREPTCSPDGKKIAFWSNRAGDLEVFVMDIDGSNPRNISKTPGDQWPSEWSPDGKEILFTSEREGNGEIYIMNSDGSNQTNLTNHRGYDDRPHLFDPRGFSVSLGGRFKATWGWLKHKIE